MLALFTCSKQTWSLKPVQDYQSLHQGQAANFVKRVSLERLNVKFCFC